MIQNDQELAATQEWSAYLLRPLGQLRVTATPEEFPPRWPGVTGPRSSGGSGKGSIT
jgi:hypothetical protein